jgi:hypothetical protein
VAPRGMVSFGRDALLEPLVQDFAPLARSVLLFFAAGVCEIGGGWLMWNSIRDGRLA